LGAAAGAVVIAPHEERLSNLMEDFPALRHPVTEYLAAKPDASAAEGRSKNASEGIGLDLAVIGAFATTAKALKLYRAGDEAGAKAVLETATPQGQTLPETATETHTAPPAPSEPPLPANAPEATDAAPRVA